MRGDEIRLDMHGTIRGNPNGTESARHWCRKGCEAGTPQQRRHADQTGKRYANRATGKSQNVGRL